VRKSLLDSFTNVEEGRQDVTDTNDAFPAVQAPHYDVYVVLTKPVLPQEPRQDAEVNGRVCTFDIDKESDQAGAEGGDIASDRE
jgi:hypothetical protein